MTKTLQATLGTSAALIVLTPLPSVAQTRATESAPEMTIEVRDEDRLVRELTDRLERDRVVSGQAINVEYLPVGIIQLSGTADTLLAKERAGRLALALSKVRGIINRIEVQSRGPANAADLQSAIRSALNENPATEAVEISIAVNAAGAVTLTGEVNSLAEKTIADRVVKLQPGVLAVHNELAVYDSPFRRPEEQVLAEVRDALAWDAFLDADNVMAEMKEGTLILTGTVPTLADKRRAEAIAWTSGVSVVDARRLAVSPEKEADSVSH